MMTELLNLLVTDRVNDNPLRDIQVVQDVVLVMSHVRIGINRLPLEKWSKGNRLRTYRWLGLAVVRHVLEVVEHSAF